MLITASLARGWNWIDASFYWGVLPILASGVLIFAARHVDPRHVRRD
jgi:hypothetical protein